MGSRRKIDARCKTCLMRHEKCLCAYLATLRSEIQCEIPVRIIMHYKEIRLPTNTGRLAKQLLPNCEVWLRGQRDDTTPWNDLINELTNPIFLYPSKKAKILTMEEAEKLPKNITLVLPDGNWRQAQKVGQRIEALRDIPHFILEEGAKSQYRLRNEPREGGLATIEAMARALGILESPKLQEQLEAAFHLMVNRVLETRAGY